MSTTLERTIEKIRSLKLDRRETNELSNYLDNISLERERDKEDKKYWDRISPTKKASFIESLVAKPFYITSKKVGLERSRASEVTEYFLHTDFERGTKYICGINNIKVNGVKRDRGTCFYFVCENEGGQYRIVDNTKGKKKVFKTAKSNSKPANYRLLIDTILENINERAEDKRGLKRALERRLLNKEVKIAREIAAKLSKFS